VRPRPKCNVCLLLAPNVDDLGVLELDWRVMRRSLPSAAASKFIEIARGVRGESEEDTSVDLDRMLRELPAEQLQDAVANLLRAEVGEILRIAPDRIDPARPMQEMGFDSLMGVELMVAVENRFGVRLPVLHQPLAGLSEPSVQSRGNVGTDPADMA